MLQSDFVRKASIEFDMPSSFIYKQLKYNNEDKNLNNEKVKYYKELLQELIDHKWKVW